MELGKSNPKRNHPRQQQRYKTPARTRTMTAMTMPTIALAYRLLLFSQAERALMHGKGLVAKGLVAQNVARRRVSALVAPARRFW